MIDHLLHARNILLLTALLVLSSCTSFSEEQSETAEVTDMELLAFRFRTDFGSALNANQGWAAGENQAAQLSYDQPFRLRVQVKSNSVSPEGHLLGLQYRSTNGEWQAAGFSRFPYPAFATPSVAVTDTLAYEHGAETEQLLGTIGIAYDEGAGLNGVATTPVWRAVDDAVEWEWPLVIRRFADGPTFNADNSQFEFRLVNGLGNPIKTDHRMAVTMRAASGHLGGTFVETPGRLGPYQGQQGDLYFFMEPTETDNRFMAMRSTDFGASWFEQDGEHRPVADDLEGVASARTGSVIHLLHQVSEEVFYHAFDLASASWVVDSESIATHAEPPTQYADLTARSDGSLVAVFSGARRLFIQIRTAEGQWQAPQEIDTGPGPVLSGPVLATADDDKVSLAYTGKDGSGFIRHLLPDGQLTARQTFATELGSSDTENGAILPLLVMGDTGTTVLIYRKSNGLLFERRFTRDGRLSAEVQVSQQTVTTDAVDSEQAGADIVSYGNLLLLLFIDEQSRSIYLTTSEQPGIWSDPLPLVEGIEGSWVRGSIHKNADGEDVYGFVYDAGSQGGAGFNRYFAYPL